MHFTHGDHTFGYDSIEERGRFVGIAENAGHAMTSKILKHHTQKILCRSNIRPGNDPITRNVRVDPITIPAIIKSRQEDFSDDDTVFTTAFIIT